MAHRTSAERLELAEYVRRHREKGYTHRQIAARLGISPSYVSELYADPDGSRTRARKATYRGTCENCGAKTDGSNGAAAAPTLCILCHGPAQKVWTREAVTDAIQRFARRHGGRPPTATEWMLANRRYRYPPASAVHGPTNAFPKWADAIEAAGFERPRVGKRAGQRHWDGPEVVIAELLVAAEDGVAPAYGSDDPLTTAAAYYFGSYRAAVAAAGLTARSERYNRWSKKRVIAEIRQAAIGAYPPAGIEDLCLRNAATRYFGSWAKAVRLAGFTPYGRGDRRGYERSRLVARREARRKARRSRAAARASAPA